MIKSMTGFGRCEKSDETRKIIVEMKAVNHRYSDINFKMPKKLAPFEIKMRNLLKEYIQRGKVDLFFTYEDSSEGNTTVSYNESIAKEYLTYMQQMSEELGLVNDIKVSHLARFPEVFTLEEQAVDEDELWQFVEPALRGACEDFLQARQAEGTRLYEDLMQKLDHMLICVEAIEERSPQIMAEYRSKLTDKVKELLENSTIDENRIAAEVTIFADKICVDEETVRLRSHITGARDILREGFESGTSNDSIGRKLDFLAQEMNREANTILSKANDITISNYGIDLKTEIERVREQIQNIE
ncbi:MAG: YicC family protein [Lachnospiraceae bacterium]|nr:YicC family protein [Lachnospiraceae bacterium]